MDWERLTSTLVILAVAVGATVAVHGVAFAVLRAVARRQGFVESDDRLGGLRYSSLLVLLALALQAAIPYLDIEGRAVAATIRHGLGLVAIVGVTWLGAAIVEVTGQSIRRRHDISAADNLDARRVYTQITVLSRSVVVLIVVVGIAAALMTFPRIREIGAGLLVSAGFAGLAIGLAARPMIENLIAGLQLAFTQPIRIDDVVVVAGEWGRIEEITSTFVVVHVWDERRLIVPFSKFISEPFQNWTRRTADILGTVFLWADYTVPVDVVRRELERICNENPLWDKKVCVLQVTDATEHAVQLRALVSAASSPAAWDLRVHVREKLIEFLQREHPGCLPRTRVALTDPDPG